METPSRLPTRVVHMRNERRNSMKSLARSHKGGKIRRDRTVLERGTWTGKFDFLVSLMGYSVGLNNVWRYPYLCYIHGGAFLIPFSSMLLIVGLPLMFMELAIGQFASVGPVLAYRELCPLLTGLGYGMVLISALVMLYYNLIISWTIHFIHVSLFKLGILSWNSCRLPWNTDNCYTPEAERKCLRQNMFYYKRSCINITQMAAMGLTMGNITNAVRKTPSQEYFLRYSLNISSGIGDIGTVQPHIAWSLLVAWIIIFLCLFRGVNNSGKIAHITAFCPYVILIILLIRGLFLPGAIDGIIFYLKPNWEKLMSADVWADAAVQTLFALSPSWGGLITLSSYNKFNNNCYRDALIVSAINVITSVLSGVFIFSMIGFLAYTFKVPIESIVDEGAGLVFTVFPEVVSRIPLGPLWSLLFFVMLLTLGLDSEFAMMETVTTAILDALPSLRKHKMWVVLGLSIFGYLGGIIFTTNAGMYWLQLVDKYATNWSVLFIAISECILVSWIYGVNRFLQDVQKMIGPQSRLWRCFWMCMWKVVTPATLFFILFFNWAEYQPLSYGDYVYPQWANYLGWFIAGIPLLVILGVALYQLRDRPLPNDDDDDDVENLDSMSLQIRNQKMRIRNCKNIWMRAKMLLQPTAKWGSAAKNFSQAPPQAPVRTPPRALVRKPPRALVRTPPPALVRTPPRTLVRTPPPALVRTPPRTLVRTPPRTLVRTPPRTLVRTPPRTLFRTPPRALFRTPPRALFRTPPRGLVRTPPRALVPTPPRVPVPTPPRALVPTPLPGPSKPNPVRDTVILINDEPMMVQSPSTSGTTKKLPGPSILKKPNGTNLKTPQKISHDVRFKLDNHDDLPKNLLPKIQHANNN